MRAVLRYSYLSVLGMFSRPSNRTHFLNGHYVSAGPTSLIVQKDRFRRLLAQLGQHATLTDPLTAKARLKQTEVPLIALTFDDGFADVREVISPVLDEFKLKALFFINPAYLGTLLPESRSVIDRFYKRGLQKEFLSVEDVRELHKRGHSIGSHGLSHIRLSTVTGETLKKEILNSKQMLEAIIGEPCVDFAYPFGGVHDITPAGMEFTLAHYDTVFSSTTQKEIWSMEGRVINRRHFEGNWPASHINYFLSRRV